MIAEQQKQIKALEKGKGAADGFGKGIKKGFGEAGKEATKFGANLVKSMGPIGLLLAVITAAINFFKEKIGGAIAENEKASAAFEKIGNIIDTFLTPIFDGLANIIGKVADGIAWLVGKFTGVDAGMAGTAKATKAATGAVKELDKAFQDEIKTVEERNKAYKNDAQYASESLSAHQKYLDALIAEKAANGDITGSLQERIDKELEIVKSLKAQSEAASKKDDTSIAKERLALEEKMRRELEVANREAARIAGEVERENFLREKQNDIYKNTRGELDKLIVQFGATRENAQKTFEFADKLDKAVGDTEKKMESETKLAAYLGERKAFEAEMAEKIRKAEFEKEQGLLTEKQLADERNKAQDEFNQKISAAAAKYDDVAVSAQAANDIIKQGSEKLDFGKLSAGLSQGVGYYNQAASSILQITQRMAEDQIESINNLLEQQKELIDRQYEETMGRLDEERQAALEAAGFAQAVTEEGQAMALEAAIASGDEGLIYKEKRRQEELAINKKFNDAEKKATEQKIAAEKKAEEDAAREIAQVQYQQAMAEWVNSLIQAAVNTAVGVTQAIAQGGILGIATGAIVGALGALQIAAVAANKPKPPAFAGGGVVGLPRTYTTGYANGGIVEANTPRGVDAVAATLANREMVLNDDQQANLFDAIDNNNLGGGGTTVVIQNIFDGAVVSEQVVRNINNGQTSKIENRMVAA